MSQGVEQSLQALNAFNLEVEKSFNDLVELAAAHHKRYPGEDNSTLQSYQTLAEANSQILAEQKTFMSYYKKIKTQIENNELDQTDIISALTKYQEDEEDSNKKELKRLLEKYEKNVDSILHPEDADVAISSVNLSFKCPLTLKIMKEPMKNSKCGHLYEKEAILSYLKKKKERARCPMAGCINKNVREKDLVFDEETLKLIHTTQGTP